MSPRVSYQNQHFLLTKEIEIAAQRKNCAVPARMKRWCCRAGAATAVKVLSPGLRGLALACTGANCLVRGAANSMNHVPFLCVRMSRASAPVSGPPPPPPCSLETRRAGSSSASQPCPSSHENKLATTVFSLFLDPDLLSLSLSLPFRRVTALL